MKYLYNILFVLLFFSLPLSATSYTDDFENNNKTGWQQDQGIVALGAPVSSNVLKLAHQNYTYKYYYFPASYASKTVNVQFDFIGTGLWNSNDTFYVLINGIYTPYTLQGADNNTPIVVNHFDINMTLDANAAFTLSFYSNANKTSEVGHIDNVLIHTTDTPPIMGDIPNQTIQEGTLFSLDIASYVTTTEGDLITNYTLSCAPLVPGLFFNSATGVLEGYPTATGNYPCTASATDKDGVSNSDSFTLKVLATPQQPPIMLAIPDQSMTINTPSSINLSTFVIPTNGDPIIKYTLSGTLPTGLSFNTATGIISGQPSAEVNATLSLMATDNDGDSNLSTFILHILPIQTINTTFRPFSLRYQETFPGKMLTIGNTILVAPTTQTKNICDTYTNGAYLSDASKRNDQYYLCPYYADKTAKFGTTQAQLTIPVNTVKTVKWAGLYWQSIIESSKDLSTMKIQLKHSQENIYHTIPYNTLDFHVLDVLPKYQNYAAFADVTSLFVDNNWTDGTITVGDIPVQKGKIDFIGAYGAWTLVLIYQDATEPLQNFSVYDGWQRVDLNNNQVDINISGFFTPKNAANSIQAQVSVFATEGDKRISGDSMSVKPSKQANFTELIPNMNSAINTTPNFTRTPSPINNQGIDIQAFELGDKGANIMQPQESNMVLRFSSSLDPVNPGSADTYFPSMVAFSAELYTPKICYDYTIRLGDTIPVRAPNRDINSSTYGTLPLKMQFLIRSEEADFNYFDSKANIVFSGGDTGSLQYKAKYLEMSPPNTNRYFSYSTNPEIEANASKGQLALGSGVIGNALNNGGELLAKEITYGIIGYDINPLTLADPLRFNTHFDLEFDAKIRFNPTDAPTNYHFTTNSTIGSRDYIPRCLTNPVYNPVPLGFNIEREATQNEPTSTRYNLWTQVTGRPYNVDIVAYTGGLNSAATSMLDFKGTVELELIDADQFLNDASAGYDTTCRNPKSIGNVGAFINFNQNGEPIAGRHTVHIPNDFAGYPFRRAVRNAAFRVWILSVNENNGSKRAIEHHCTKEDNSDGCLTQVYHTQIDTNLTGQCITECTGNNPECYKCLKDYYATPICSRDNFSIRPDSFIVRINDDNDKDPATIASNELQNNLSITPVTVSAGYNYLLKIATSNYQADTTSIGYFNTQYKAQEYTTIPNKFTAGPLAIMEFSTSNPNPCNDTNSSTIQLEFGDGALVRKEYGQFPNVGTYDFWLSDSNWTVVDHADYPFKPRFDMLSAPTNDCTINSFSAPNTGMVGCTFYSVNGNKNKIIANVKPYRFSMSDIQVKRYPDDTKNYTFYNDFSHPYYQSLVVNPIQTSVTYEGLLIAKGKHIQRLSNFTRGCAASDVIINASIRTNPSDVNATTPLQQYLQDTSIYTNPTDTSLGYDKNLTLSRNAFPDTLTNGIIKPGKAKIYLHTTFRKNKKNPQNPLIGHYGTIRAWGTMNSYSNTNMSSAYVPEGNNTGLDRNITYYFAKVTPFESFYDNVTQSSIITPISVNIYCDLYDCNTSYGLDTMAINNDANWYVPSLFDPAKDGTTDLNTTTIFGTPAAPSVTPNNAIQFTSANITRNDINVSLAGTARPTTVDIQINAVPWLTFNPLDPIYGYAHYRVKFIGNSSWLGVGNTGKVTETTSNRDSINRMNW